MSVETSVLANGLRVVTSTMPHVETVSVGVWVAVGARYETKANNGISHMLEHMAFKGTHSRSAAQIAAEVEAVGGHINAYTARETTAYYLKTLKEDLPLSIDILSDILQRSAFQQEELEREREVILQEIGQAADIPDDVIFDQFQAIAYPDQPMGRPILGDTQIVENLTRQQLIDHMGSAYNAPGMVLAGAGNLNHKQFVDLATAAFSTLGTAPEQPAPSARYEGGDCREDRPLEQVHWVIGLPGVSLTGEDYFAASLHATILGGGMSSRLFQEVREKRGLVYNISAYNSAYLDGGIYGVYAGTGPELLPELVPVVFDQIASMSRPVAEEELARAKAQLKASLLMSLESTGARAEQLAQQILVFGRTLSVAELTAKIEEVDVSVVARFGEKLLQGPLTSAALGPISQLESADRMQARLAA